MSINGRKGYRGEAPIEELLRLRYGGDIRRPRAGSRRDAGDIAGLPIVISVKNCGRLELASWVDDLPAMVEVAGKEIGVVWHHRKGKGRPEDWYVTTSGRLFLPLLDVYRRIHG